MPTTSVDADGSDSAAAALGLVPKLQLGGCGTGGGWGLGEQVSWLPPAEEQQRQKKRIYQSVQDAPGYDPTADNRSSDLGGEDDVADSAAAVPVTTYVAQAEDDDDTFVDHGSVVAPVTPPRLLAGVKHRGTPCATSQVVASAGVGSSTPLPPTSGPHPRGSPEPKRSALRPGTANASDTVPDTASNVGRSSLTSSIDRLPYDNPFPMTSKSSNLRPATFSDFAQQHAAMSSSSKTPAPQGSGAPSGRAAPPAANAAAPRRANGVAAPAFRISPSPSRFDGSSKPNDVEQSSGSPQGPPRPSLSPSTAVAGPSTASSPSPAVPSPVGPLSRLVPTWNPLRLLSRLSMQHPVQSMVMSPDGRSVWTAIGDDPLTQFDMKGVELEQSRTISNVTQVTALAVVSLTGVAKSTTFKTATPKTSKSKKSPSSVSGPSTSARAAESAAEEENYVLWCGLTRGAVGIVDLSGASEVGFIRGAHTQTISRVWSPVKGRVWTAGRDKSFKVWDAQTRRKLKSRNIAAIVTGACVVKETGHVWTMAEDDACIRVFDLGGENVRVASASTRREHGEPALLPTAVVDNAIRMRGEVSVLEYSSDGNVVWVGLRGRGTVLMDPNTFEPVATLDLTITAVAFHKKTAVVTGRGGLIETEEDCVALLDVTNPLCPSLLFLGSAMPGVCSPIGLLLFSHPPVVAIVHHLERAPTNRVVSITTYEETKALTELSGALKDQPIAPQKKINVGRRPTARAVEPPPPTVTPAADPSPRSTGCAPVSSTSPAGGQPVAAPAPVARSDGTVVAGAGTNVIYRPTVLGGRPEVQATVYRTGLAGPLPPSPEVMASLSKLNQKVDESMGLLTNLRRTEAPLSDFAHLHQQLTSWILQEGGVEQEAAPLSPEEVLEIHGEYTTPEGRAGGIAVAKLLKLSRLRRTQEAEINPRGDFAGTGAADAHPTVPLTSEARREDSYGSSMHLVGGAESDSVSQTTQLRETEAAAMAQWAEQVSRSNAEVRRASERQLRSLQKHNQRISDRNEAYVLGLTRIQQSVCTYGQCLLDELDGSESLDQDREGKSQRQLQLSAALAESAKRMGDLNSSCSVAEINNAVNSVGKALASLVAAQQQFSRSFPRRGSHLTRDVSSPPTTNGWPTHGFSPERGNSPTLSPVPRASLELDGVSSVDAKQTTQRQAEAAIQDRVTALESFVPNIHRTWSRVEDMRRVMLLAYSNGVLPDLNEDFTQCILLADLMVAQVMIDVCREESILAMAEALYEIKDRSSPDERPAQAHRSHRAEDSLERSTGTLTEHSEHRPTRLVASALDVQNGDGQHPSMTTTDEMAPNLVFDTAPGKLVALSIDMESITSRIRAGLLRQREDAPPALLQYIEEAVAKCGPQSSRSSMRSSAGMTEKPFLGFLSMTEPLRTSEGRLRGLLYWSHIALHLITECMQCVESLLFPHAKPSASNGTPSSGRPSAGAPITRTMSRQNFLLLSQRMGDWSILIGDIEQNASSLRQSITVSQLIGQGATSHATSQRPSNVNRLVHGGSSGPNATWLSHAAGSHREGPASDVVLDADGAANRYPSGAHVHHVDPTPSPPDLDANDADEVVGSRSSGWLPILECYLQLVMQSAIHPPLLFFSAEEEKAAATGDVSVDWQSYLDEIAESSEEICMKTGHLKVYCTVLEQRISDLTEENMSIKQEQDSSSAAAANAMTSMSAGHPRGSGNVKLSSFSGNGEGGLTGGLMNSSETSHGGLSSTTPLGEDDVLISPPSAPGSTRRSGMLDPRDALDGGAALKKRKRTGGYGGAVMERYILDFCKGNY